MNWLRSAWYYIVGSPEECGCISDPQVLLKIRFMVKRAYMAGIITGFLLFALIFAG